MRSTWLVGWSIVLSLAGIARAADGNRLAYLDQFSDPYYVGLQTAKLTTPQWIGEEGIETAIVLSIDDLGDTARYEAFLRPILDRLKQIDGRSPLSIMTKHIDGADPIVVRWAQEGVNLETHTYDHPCPCLQRNSFEKAKATYDRSVDVMATATGGRAKAFRMPCCDSMNSASPRFFAEIFNRTTPLGNFQVLDSSVLMLHTAADSSLPRSLVQQDDGRPRFAKYVPIERKFVNYVEDYPYPYVIARLCWEIPTAIPDDWQGFNLQQAHSPATVADMKAALDAAVLKQGVYVLTFHPGAWIRNDQVIELIDYAVKQYGKKVKFLNFREVHERLTANVLAGHPLRAANGQDNGVRVLDVNNDGYMDVVIGNDKVRQTRVWSPADRRWLVGEFPSAITSPDGQGHRQEAGVQFGVLQSGGNASVLVRNDTVAGLWHFDGRAWQRDAKGLAGLEGQTPVFTRLDGKDGGVRLFDVGGDGICELIVGNSQQSAVYQWLPDRHAWTRLSFTLPDGTAVVDAEGRDAGCRFVDIDEDGHLDVVFSNADRYSLHLFCSMTEGWSRKVFAGVRSDERAIPMIVRGDGTNNGVWFKYRQALGSERRHGRDRAARRKSRAHTRGRPPVPHAVGWQRRRLKLKRNSPLPFDGRGAVATDTKTALGLISPPPHSSPLPEGEGGSLVRRPYGWNAALPAPRSISCLSESR